MRILPFLLLLTLSVSAQAGGYAPAAPTVRVSAGDITAPGFSLRASLAALGCHGDITATPLSLFGDLLSVQVTGTLCGQSYSDVNVYSVFGHATPTLTELFGERTVVSALKRDPYLNAAAPLRGDTLSELGMSFSEQGPRGECPASPSALRIADHSYAFWKTAGQQINVRLALPLSCGDTQTNDFVWLGLMLPTSSLTEPVTFDFAHRPTGTAHIRW